MVTPIIEKDAIVFLGLMAIAYKNFDPQFIHADNIPTHTNGLNIFAAIIDNSDGEVIGQRQNHIHAECNPMLHAEQLTLNDAIKRVNEKRKRDAQTVSVENYYRNSLFNTQNAPGDFNKGATIYTTLEPCPFCTSALLVTRMKRIVYIIPDATYGHSFGYLKDEFYKSYDITYQNIGIPTDTQSAMITHCATKLSMLIKHVKGDPKRNATLYLDDLKDFLKDCHDEFLKLKETDLSTEGEDRLNNLRTLMELQIKAR